MASVTLQGNAMNTNGDLPAVGSAAPDFSLANGDLQDVGLADFSGRKKLLNIVPSLDTPTCAISTRKFNEYADEHPDAVVLIVSADLPFAQGRFCTGESLSNVVPLSMMPWWSSTRGARCSTPNWCRKLPTSLTMRPPWPLWPDLDRLRHLLFFGHISKSL